MAINFGLNRPWGGVSQHEYRRWATNPKHALAYRVHFAALGWADCQGHAAFGPGRLAELLGKDGVRLSDQSTRNAIGRAKALDLVSPRSGAACLVLPPHLFQKGKGAPVPSCWPMEPEAASKATSGSSSTTWPRTTP